MAVFDKATSKFMEDVATDIPARNRGQVLRRTQEDYNKDPLKLKKGLENVGVPADSSTVQKAKTYGTAAISLASGKRIPSMIGKQITRELFEKEGSETQPMKILDLYNTLMVEYGKEWLGWENETLRHELPLSKRLASLSEEEYEKVFALQVIAKTDYPTEAWNTFENVGHALAGNTVLVDYITPLSIEECILLVRTIESIRKEAKLSDDVCAYIGASALDSGLVLLPPSVDHRAQEVLDDLGMDISIKERVLAALEGSNSDHDLTIKIQIERLKGISEYVEETLGGYSG